MTPAWDVGFAFCAGVLALLAAIELGRTLAPAARARAPRAARRGVELAGELAQAGSEGRVPGTVERRRLLAAGALAAFIAGAFVAGPLSGLALACAGPWVVARVLRLRRERHRRAVEDGAPTLALALADALGGGHSLRGAIVEAAPGIGGAAGVELRRVATELALGSPTDAALEEMRTRSRSQPIDTIVAAALLQRRAGGDLAALLRDCARAFEDGARLRGEVRAATAQARFTGLIVVLLPLGGALLAELASPGFLRGLAGSFLTAWLVGIAVVLQIVAAVAIRRLGRVRA